MRPAGLAAIAAVFLLAGCAYLLDSPFPAYVPLLVDEKDVADDMPYEDGAHYEVRVVSSASGEYVWLYGEGPGFGERFVLLDSDLHRVFSGVDSGDTFHGESLLAFGAGRLCIGRQVYDPATFLRLPDATWSGNWGYFDPDAARFTFAYTASPDVVAWSGWDGPGTGETTYSSATISGYGNAGIASLYHDVRGDRVAVYGRVDLPPLVLGVVASAGAFPPPSNPLIGDPNAFVITPDSGDFDRPQFAGDGTVIRYHEEDLLVFYDLEGNEGDSISVRDSGESAYGFSPSGRYWYVFRAETGRLMKVRTWW